MKHFKTNFDKVQTSGMYSSEDQKLFIDNLINKFHTESPTISQLSTLTDNLSKLLSNIPSKKLSNSDLISKNYSWFHEGHSSCSNFTISSPKGIYPFGLSVLNLSSVDRRIKLLLVLDPNTFNPKDHLNYRYLNKRNATLHYYFEYLNDIKDKKRPEWSNIATTLRELNKSQSDLQVTLESQLDYRKISIRISQRLDNGFSVILVAGYDDFDLNFNRRLASTNNCIRPEAPADISTLPMTITYNSLVFEESQYLINHELISNAFIGFKNLASALVLMKLWLERDESNSALLNQFPYDLVMAHVCISRKLSANASNYQIFSSAIHFIANFRVDAVYTYGSNSISDKGATDFANLPIDFPILLNSNGYNILWKCFLGFSGLVSRSREALSQQQTYQDDSIYLTKCLFVNKKPLFTRFSYIAHLDAGSNQLKLYNDRYEDFIIASKISGLTVKELAAISAESILKLALLDRLEAIDFITCDDGSIKLLLNFNVITRKVDKGVLSSGDLAQGYTKFWQGLAETRIFSGHQPFLCILPSNICQPNECPNISLVKYILAANGIKLVSMINYQSIYNGSNDKLQNHAIGARGSFETVTSILFSLDYKNMPLRVSRVTLLDFTSFSHSDYWIPFSVYIQLESSSAWPKEPTAVRYVTCAFYLSLYKEIQNHPQFKSISSKKTIFPTWRHLEITLGDYRYYLSIDGTGSDLDRINRIEAIKALSQKESSFGPAVKLVKEWAAVNSIPEADELIEALGIHVYNTNKPKSISCGFYSILDFLSNFEWSTHTLVVFLDGTVSKILKKEDSQPISVRIGNYRVTVPNPYLISLLLPLASNMLERNNITLSKTSVNKDFTIILNNPYNSDVNKKLEGQFIIRSFVQSLRDKFPYLILLYNPLLLDGITESILGENQTEAQLEIYCKVNPLCILSMATPYLAIANYDGLIAINVAQVISELIAAGTGIIRDIVF